MARPGPAQLETDPPVAGGTSGGFYAPAEAPSRAALPSLPESHRTIPFSTGASWFRKVLAFAGPGYLVAVGYMDPGNWATDIGGGSKFGYTLLSVILISNLMAMFLQALSAKLGIATGRDLPRALFPPNRTVSLGGLRNRHRSVRPGRSSGLGRRAEASLRAAASGRCDYHRVRCPHRAGAARPRVSTGGSLCCHAYRIDRGLLRVRNLFRSSALARSRHRLH